MTATDFPEEPTIDIDEDGLILNISLKNGETIRLKLFIMILSQEADAED